MYFLLITTTDAEQPFLIDIGESCNWRRRLAQHQANFNAPGWTVEPLCVVRGLREDEQQVHRSFAHCRYRDEPEVFRPEPELVDYIRWLRDQHFVWVPDDEKCQPLEDLPQLGSEFWMPGAGRSKPRAESRPAPAPPGPGPAELLPGFYVAPAPPSPGTALERLGLPARRITVDDYYTNPAVAEAARQALGGTIDLDPASHPVANRVIGAARIYTAAEDGLAQPWHGRVWLNPPFSQWRAWTRKLLEEWRSGDVEAICALAHTRTLTANYFAPVHAACDAFCFEKGRLGFWGGRVEKAKSKSPQHGNGFFYFGPEPDRFHAAFAPLGSLYRPFRL